MKRLTSKAISSAILEKFGVKGVMVHCSGGMCNWYSDTNEHAAKIIFSGTNGVSVCRINHLSLSQWLDEFESMWNENSGNEYF